MTVIKKDRSELDADLLDPSLDILVLVSDGQATGLKIHDEAVATFIADATDWRVVHLLEDAQVLTDQEYRDWFGNAVGRYVVLCKTGHGPSSDPAGKGLFQKLLYGGGIPSGIAIRNVMSVPK
jgi:hypothetical protein